MCFFAALVFLIFAAAAMARSRWKAAESKPRFLRAYVWWGGLAVLCFLALVTGCYVGTTLANSS